MSHLCLALIIGIILIFSAVTLGGYNNFVSAQSQHTVTLSSDSIIPVIGGGQCRGFNDVKPQIYLVSEHCVTPAPTPTPTPTKSCQPLATDKPLNMSLSTKGHDFLAKQEGYAGLDSKTCSETVTTDCRMSDDTYGFYDDPSGYCTVGIGKLIAKKDCAAIDKLPDTDKVKQGKNDFNDIKTQEQANKLLDTTLSDYEKAVNDNIKVQLTQEQFDALVDFTYNEGVSNLKISDLLKDINQGKCDSTTIGDGKSGDLSHFTNGGLLSSRRTDEGTLFSQGTY